MTLQWRNRWWNFTCMVLLVVSGSQVSATTGPFQAVDIRGSLSAVRHGYVEVTMEIGDPDLTVYTQWSEVVRTSGTNSYSVPILNDMHLIPQHIQYQDMKGQYMVKNYLTVVPATTWPPQSSGAMPAAELDLLFEAHSQDGSVRYRRGVRKPYTMYGTPFAEVVRGAEVLDRPEAPVLVVDGGSATLTYQVATDGDINVKVTRNRPSAMLSSMFDSYDVTGRARVVTEKLDDSGDSSLWMHTVTVSVRDVIRSAQYAVEIECPDTSETLVLTTDVLTGGDSGVFGSASLHMEISVCDGRDVSRLTSSQKRNGPVEDKRWEKSEDERSTSFLFSRRGEKRFSPRRGKRNVVTRTSSTTLTFSPGVKNCVRCTAAGGGGIMEVGLYNNGYPVGSDYDHAFYWQQETPEVTVGTLVLRNPSQMVVGDYVCRVLGANGQELSETFSIEV